MSDKQSIYYEFGQFRFSPRDKNLWRGNELLSLSPTAIEVLSILLEKRPEPATRNELLDRAWKDTAVEEANVTVAISAIRKLLSSNGAADKEFIRTIPKKGYLFVGEVKEVYETAPEPKNSEPGAIRPHTDSPSRWFLIAILVVTTLFVTSFSVWLTWGDGSEISSIPTENREYKSVAVLPLKDLGKDNEPLLLGITDNLITRLGKINKFAVRPLSAVESFHESGRDALQFGRDLKVDAVFVGTLQQTDDRIRVNVRLLDTRDGAQIWSDKYDETERDVFDLQDALSIQVAKGLISKLTPEESNKLTKPETANLDAFRTYNTGRFYLSKRTRDDIKKAIPYFEKATELDPNYASAYSTLAGALLLLTDSSFAGSPKDVERSKIESAIDKAISLDRDSHEAYASKGFLLVVYDWDLDAALENYDRSIKINPNDALTRNWKAWSLIAQKRFDEAMVEMKAARDLDPASRIIAAEAGLPLLFAGKFAEAEPLFREAVEMDSNFYQARYRMWYLLFVSGRHKESEMELQAMRQLTSEDDLFNLGLKAATLAQTGKQTEAKKILSLLEREFESGNRLSPTLLASIATGLNEPKRAKKWLEAAFSDKNDYLLYFEIAPEYKPLQKEPWYGDFVKRIRNGTKGPEN